MGLPPVDAIFTAIEEYLDANFHVSLNSPHLLVTFHAKVAGLKAYVEKLKA